MVMSKIAIYQFLFPVCGICFEIMRQDDERISTTKTGSFFGFFLNVDTQTKNGGCFAVFPSQLLLFSLGISRHVMELFVSSQLESIRRRCHLTLITPIKHCDISKR